MARRVELVLAVFFVSGVSGLIYEVAWFRLLSLSFGVSVYAASAVLTAFMGGLALGSWFFGRIMRGAQHAAPLPQITSGAQHAAPLRVFAVLQTGVALFAFVTPALSGSLTDLYVWLAREFRADQATYNAVRTLLATLALVPPTFLMGGTLPVLAQVLAIEKAERGRRLGALYAVNTFGGVVGALLAGLFLIPALGVSGALYLGGSLDLVVAAVAFWLARQWPAEPAQLQDEPKQPAPAVLKSPEPQPAEQSKRARRTAGRQGSGGQPVVAMQTAGGGIRTQARGGAVAALQAPDVAAGPLLALNPARLALIGYAVSGFAALGYQVVWTRTLAIFSLNAVFSFTIMLVTFLIGLAAGSAWMARRVDQSSRPLALFGWLQLGIGACAVLALYAFARMPTLLAMFTARTTFASSLWAEFFAAAVIMILPTLLMGAVFPVAARLYTTQNQESRTRDQTLDLSTGVRHTLASHSVHDTESQFSVPGSDIGRLYALNTVGATIGAFAAGFVLIPALGLRNATLLLALLSLAVGVVALLATPAGVGSRMRLAGALGVTVLGAALLPPGVYLGFREGVIPELVYYKEGIDATVAVFEVKNPPLKMSFVNGRSEVPTDRHSMRAFHLLGHLPALLHPEAQNALMISFGNGIASGAMATHPIPRIHAIELVAEQVEAARLYQAENRGVLDRPGFQVTIEDGRNYLLRSNERYDIITADATHPINSSSWALFTSEFYTMVKGRLADDGVFIQWLPFHDLAERDYRDIIHTFQSVFPHTTLWYTGATHSFLVATPQPLTREQVLALDTRLKESTAGTDLGDGRLLAADFIMTEQEVAEFAANARIVTDDRAFFIPAMDRERILAELEPYARQAAR